MCLQPHITALSKSANSFLFGVTTGTLQKDDLQMVTRLRVSYVNPDLNLCCSMEPHLPSRDMKHP